MADRPDGLDCDQVPQIPAERCGEWKARNGNGRWWCNWNHATGALDAVYGSRDEPVSPGLDLRHITRESARSDQATQTLLEAYARQLIRQHESLFGFKPQGYELRLTDFHRRPEGTRRLVRDDESVDVETLSPVSSIHLEQIVRQLPLHGAEIEIQVDDDNRLVSFFSSFEVDVPSALGKHILSNEEALSAALSAVLPGVALEEGRVGVEPIYALDTAEIVPAFKVHLSFPDRDIDGFAIVHGMSGTILQAPAEVDEFEAPLGHESIGARAFPLHPPFEQETTSDESIVPVLASIGAAPSDFVSALLDVDLRFLRSGEQLALDGYFTKVVNREQPSWTSAQGSILLPRDEWTMLVDLAPGGGYQQCPEGKAVPETSELPFPGSTFAVNDESESRFDEVSAYYHVTNIAEQFKDRFDYEMNRSGNADPQLLTLVNSGGRDPKGTFKNGCVTVCGPFGLDCQTACLPHIAINRSVCWRMLEQGVGVDFNLGGPFGTTPADFYSWRDLSRDSDVVAHEFTHAITWDVVPMELETSGEEFDEAGGAFREAIADFFPLSFTNNSLYSPWQRRRELDPVQDAPGGGVEERDYAWPYDRHPTDEKHENGRIWSNFLWDLRKRGELIEQELGSSGISARTAEDLQWEALFRMPRTMKSWRTPLRRLLDADEGHTGSQMSYEIVASAARHGLKLTDAIAAVEPNHYVFERGTGVEPILTIYSGSHSLCHLDLSSDPTFPEGSTISEICAEPFCTAGVIPRADDLENRVFRCNLSSFVDQLAPDPSVSSPIFYRVTTSRGAFGSGEPVPFVISGGGNTILHQDIPAIFIVPQGGAGCLPVCAVAWGQPRAGSTVFLFVVGLLFALWRRRVGR